jgi:hypothetical protein
MLRQQLKVVLLSGLLKCHFLNFQLKNMIVNYLWLPCPLFCRFRHCLSPVQPIDQYSFSVNVTLIPKKYTSTIYMRQNQNISVFISYPKYEFQLHAFQNGIVIYLGINSITTPLALLFLMLLSQQALMHTRWRFL